ncbi:MAG TPA: molybdate ABC transporter permease subunit [Pseudomonadales bacterium]|jgi:molybdate transport system permease protein|nr:molybdate ABC transporter permease subunit [Pseudomonadales bacterium]MDP6315767.1 molybdate ABC transporter permease subunit [Pseudomonadales bacterium]MDP7315764.1 molybdate ABC transporter permease subunit [Pseudomonadales bacterium]MDP7577814.1 molybdate ABC transporter permease subunit [Pseudomonadales bacterium]HJL61022.1 molybdate ABC transporter permease subunit [Pseudomonadales bacterium]|tara:strand:+ start:207 stop:878 length:672 start_codon:yes stop_codon:yes gene_type:complete
MNDGDLTSLLITAQLASITTIILALIGTPLAWWLARTSNPIRVLVEPIVALPIVLPPTVLGFYFLMAFSPDNFLGNLWILLTGSPLAFTFSALVIGSVFYSLPFYVQPLQVAFENVEQGLLDAAATLGASNLDSFFSVIVPLSRRGFVVAACLAFAHTVGEFGIVLMIGGNIPGETRVLSIALFDHVESLQYQNAHILAGGLMIFSFLLLSVVYSLNRKWQSR